MKNRPKPFHFAIVDEVDSVLIDEGRNPLLISGEVNCGQSFGGFSLFNDLEFVVTISRIY